MQIPHDYFFERLLVLEKRLTDLENHKEEDIASLLQLLRQSRASRKEKNYV
ncbi:hypothetical protein ACFOLK_06765 [Marinococcus halophilus]|uniref:Uncharacterized protein n=1 Tax=Marinococcus halophilus TaxID=1371 RepID=A0A510Y7P5_MARHA|nr:hypothetical protein [Marinococcus halophilus]GEK59382.1 hypothetical protein MHA01_22870 [Marinococcus halophilus]